MERRKQEEQVGALLAVSADDGYNPCAARRCHIPFLVSCLIYSSQDLVVEPDECLLVQEDNNRLV